VCVCLCVCNIVEGKERSSAKTQRRRRHFSSHSRDGRLRVSTLPFFRASNGHKRVIAENCRISARRIFIKTIANFYLRPHNRQLTRLKNLYHAYSDAASHTSLRRRMKRKATRFDSREKRRDRARLTRVKRRNDETTEYRGFEHSLGDVRRAIDCLALRQQLADDKTRFRASSQIGERKSQDRSFSHRKTRKDSRSPFRRFPLDVTAALPRSRNVRRELAERQGEKAARARARVHLALRAERDSYRDEARRGRGSPLSRDDRSWASRHLVRVGRVPNAGTTNVGKIRNRGRPRLARGS